MQDQGFLHEETAGGISCRICLVLFCANCDCESGTEEHEAIEKIDIYIQANRTTLSLRSPSRMLRLILNTAL